MLLIGWRFPVMVSIYKHLREPTAAAPADSRPKAAMKAFLLALLPFGVPVQ